MARDELAEELFKASAKIIIAVHNNDPCKSTTVREKVGISSNYTSQKIETLAEKHKILKVEKTGRSNQISLTEKGRKIAASLKSIKHGDVEFENPEGRVQKLQLH